MRESDHGVIGTHLDHRCLFIYVNRDGVVLHLGGNTKIAEDLPRKNPRFKRSVLLSQNRSPRTDNSKWICGDCVSDDFERNGLFKWKVIEGLRLCLAIRRKIKEAQARQYKARCFH